MCYTAKKPFRSPKPNMREPSRCEDIRRSIECILRGWWSLVLAIFVTTVGLGFALNFGLIESESAKWVLSTLIQAGVALMGIFFVAIGLLWGQCHRDMEKLDNLVHSYMREFTPDSAVVTYLHAAASASRTEWRPLWLREFKEIIDKLLALVYASSVSDIWTSSVCDADN